MAARRGLLVTVLGIVVASSTGCAFVTNCTFFLCSGGGPLTREEVGDWLGVEPREQITRADLREREADLESIHDFGMFGDRVRAPVQDLDLRWKRTGFWMALVVPGQTEDEMLWLRANMSGARRFYESRYFWGPGLIIGAFLLAGDGSDSYDVDTGTRMGTTKSNIFLWRVGYWHQRDVLPADRTGSSGWGWHGWRGITYALDPKVPLNDVRFNVREGTSLLLGAIAWGRVNRKRYIQILWIPIPVGKVNL